MHGPSTPRSRADSELTYICARAADGITYVHRGFCAISLEAVAKTARTATSRFQFFDDLHLT